MVSRRSLEAGLGAHVDAWEFGTAGAVPEFSMALLQFGDEFVAEVPHVEDSGSGDVLGGPALGAAAGEIICQGALDHGAVEQSIAHGVPDFAGSAFGDGHESGEPAEGGRVIGENDGLVIGDAVVVADDGLEERETNDEADERVVAGHFEEGIDEPELDLFLFGDGLDLDSGKSACASDAVEPGIVAHGRTLRSKSGRAQQAFGGLYSGLIRASGASQVLAG